MESTHRRCSRAPAEGLACLGAFPWGWGPPGRGLEQDRRGSESAELTEDRKLVSVVYLPWDGQCPGHFKYILSYNSQNDPLLEVIEIRI